MSVSSQEVNYLLYRYMLENGFEHSAFVFLKESFLDLSLIKHTDVEESALVSYLMRGLKYTKMEKHSGRKGKCDSAFSLIEKHICQKETTPSIKIKKRSIEKNPVLFIGSHEEAVNVCSWSKKYPCLVSGSKDTTAIIWDFSEGYEKDPIKHKLDHSNGGKNKIDSSVTTAEWSPDGEFVATGTYLGECRLWNKKGELVSLLENRSVSNKSSDGIPTPVFVLKWSPNGKNLCCGSVDRKIVLWEIKDEICLKETFLQHESSILDIDWKNENCFASCSADSSVIIHQINEENKTKKLIGHKNEINTVRWACSENILATGSDDTTVRIWCDETGECLRVLKAHTKGVYCVRWSKTDNGLILATASYDKTIKIWNCEEGILLSTLSGHLDSIYNIAFSPSGKYLASSSIDKTVRIWCLWKETKEHSTHKLDGPVLEVGWSNDGETLAACTSTGFVFVISI